MTTTVHGVSGSRPPSLCRAVHFLLAVLSAHCCAFAIFLLLRHVFSDAAVNRSHVVTLTISKTVRPSLFVCIL